MTDSNDKEVYYYVDAANMKNIILQISQWCLVSEASPAIVKLLWLTRSLYLLELTSHATLHTIIQTHYIHAKFTEVITQSIGSDF